MPRRSHGLFGHAALHGTHEHTIPRLYILDIGCHRIDYAGNGQWSREEDIYNPANFGELLTNWQNAKAAASAGL